MSTPTITPPGWYQSNGAMHWWTGSEWNDGAADASTRPDLAPPLVHPNGEPGSYWPPVTPPKNHTTRNVLLICAGAALVVGAIAGIGVAGGSHTTSPAAAPTATSQPAAPAAPAAPAGYTAADDQACQDFAYAHDDATNGNSDAMIQDVVNAEAVAINPVLSADLSTWLNIVNAGAPDQAAYAAIILKIDNECYANTGSDPVDG